MDIEIRHRGNHFTLICLESGTANGSQLLHSLYSDKKHNELTPDEIHLALQSSGLAELTAPKDSDSNRGGSVQGITLIRTKKITIKPRGLNQQRYVRAIQTHDINFGTGPAGTGKTYLAVACAVDRKSTRLNSSH